MNKEDFYYRKFYPINTIIYKAISNILLTEHQLHNTTIDYCPNFKFNSYGFTSLNRIMYFIQKRTSDNFKITPAYSLTPKYNSFQKTYKKIREQLIK